MFVQSTPHTEYMPAPNATQTATQAMSDTPRPEARSHVIRFAVDNVPISVVVSDRPVGGVGGGEGFLTLESSGVRPAAEGVTVLLTSRSLHAGLEGIRDQLGQDVIVTGAGGLCRDPVIEGLARALVARGDIGQGLGSTYTNAICAALVTRLIALGRTWGLPGASGRCKTALPKWRLKRVVEYVEAHLARRISLADMAATAGLTRMHFAAQFRLATGVRPREYVLRRRVERAQQLMRESNRALVDVALSVGFQTQAHFTTVFKRFAGQTPLRWRQAVTALQQ